MPPFIFPLVFIALIFTGVWGSMILSARLKRMSTQEALPPNGPEIQGILENADQLEERVGRLEEDLSFFRELYQRESPAQLPPSETRDS